MFYSKVYSKSNAYTEVPAVETSTLPNPADDKDSSDDDLTLVEADDLCLNC